MACGFEEKGKELHYLQCMSTAIDHGTEGKMRQ